MHPLNDLANIFATLAGYVKQQARTMAFVHFIPLIILETHEVRVKLEALSTNLYVFSTTCWTKDFYQMEGVCVRMCVCVCVCVRSVFFSFVSFYNFPGTQNFRNTHLAPKQRQV